MRPLRVELVPPIYGKARLLVRDNRRVIDQCEVTGYTYAHTSRALLESRGWRFSSWLPIDALCVLCHGTREEVA